LNPFSIRGKPRSYTQNFITLQLSIITLAVLTFVVLLKRYWKGVLAVYFPVNNPAPGWRIGLTTLPPLPSLRGAKQRINPKGEIASLRSQ
jgi:hypothetical protein